MEKGQIYRCSVCGNIVEVLHVGGGTLICCGKPIVFTSQNRGSGDGKTHTGY